MATWEPVDIDPIDRDEIGEEDYEWADDLMNDLKRRFNQLRQFNKILDPSRNEDIRTMTTISKNALKKVTTDLVADQIYDKLTILFNDTRKKLGIKKVYL